MIEKNLASVRQLSCDHGLFRHLPSLFTPTSVYAPGATAPQTFTGEGRGGFAPDRLRQTHGARGEGVTWSRLVGQVASRLRCIPPEEKTGSAHSCTPFLYAQIVYTLQIEKKKTTLQQCRTS